MEENIRSPDIAYYDCLICHPPPPTPADELEHIIQQSRMEYETHQNKIETELYELYEKERLDRLHKFANVKKICRRLIAISPNDKPTLELFLSLIGLFETDNMNNIDVELAFYNDLFSILEKTRLSKEDIENCRNIIQCQK
jgi:hypothetical protein